MLKIKQKPKITFKRKRDNNAKKKIKKLVKYLRSELGSSTSHGLPYIVNTELHWFERLFWMASVVGCAAFIFFLLSSQYARYLAAPIVMSVEKDYFSWNVSFPSVMLCPLNKINGELHADFVNESLLLTGQDLSAYLEAITLTSLDTIHLLQLPAADLLPLINSSDYATLAAQVFKRFDNTTLTTNTNWPMTIEPVMTEMGMCHMINSNIAVFDNPSKWSDSSVTYTTTNIELSFHDSDFFVEIVNYADAYKIYTLSPNDMQLSGAPALSFDEEGFISFGVQMSSTRASPNVKSMSIHMRKCRFVDEPATSRYSVYSYNRCLMECRIEMIKILCGCVPHFYKPLADEKVCNLAELTCVNEYKKEISTLSASNKTMTMFEGLPRNSRDCGCVGDCTADFYQRDSETFLPQEEMNRLKILVATFPRVRIMREIIFSFYDIVLKSGGIVNLCIGTSVISIMELLMTIIRIPIYETAQVMKCIYKGRRKSKVLQLTKKNK